MLGELKTCRHVRVTESIPVIFWVLVGVSTLLAVGSAFVTVALARQSPPAQLASAASTVRSAAIDLDSRVAGLEREFASLRGHVDAQVIELQGIATQSQKRLARARRAEQAQGNLSADGEGSIDQYPPGHPARRRMIENMR